MASRFLSGYSLSLVLTILVFVATCAGCGPAAVSTPTPEPVTLRFAYREHTVELQPLIDAFHEQNPWITVELVPTERFGNGIEPLVRGGMVDIFLDSSFAVGYAQQGLLKPLDDLQLGDWASIMDDYYPGTWESLRVEGLQWGIPANMDAYVAYINLDHANAVHLDLPPPDWTLFEFLELANAMNYPEGLPYLETSSLIGFCTAPDSVDSVVFAYRHGGTIVDSVTNPKVATLDDALTVEAVQWYADLFNRYGVAPAPELIRTTFRQGGVYEAQVRGACGVWFGPYSSRGGLDAPFTWTVSWRMLPLPRDAAPFNLGGVEGYFIHRDCAHPKAAIDLARFLSDYWEAAGTRLPPRRSLVESDGYRQHAGNEVADVALSLASDEIVILPAQVGPALERVGGAFISAVQRIVAEDMSATMVLGEAQDRVRTSFQAP
jgi:ABC-type glycerol-3-phosphate transport system substrate-binding protein